jgi:hypothetical protein
MNNQIREPIFYGCIREPGHYAYRPDGSRRIDEVWLRRFDGVLHDEDSDEWFVHVFQMRPTGGSSNKMTAIARRDRTIDSRPCSNAIFFCPGERNKEEMFTAFVRFFPEVAKRLGVIA